MSAPALQLGFTFGPHPRASIEARFARFHADNPHIYALIEAAALRRFHAGAPRIGAKALYEEIRGTVGTTEQRPSMDNSFTALYSRELIQYHPELAAVIETRSRRGGPLQSAPTRTSVSA